MTKEKQDFSKKAVAKDKKHEKPIAMVPDVLFFLSDLTLSSQDD